MATNQTPGPRDDGVDTWVASPQELNTYNQAEAAIRPMPVPVLVSSKDPHSRMFVACLDGTNNDMNNVPAGEKITNVAAQYLQIRYLKDPQIKAGYEPGVGTQKDWQSSPDGTLGYTYPQKLESMYLKFIKQAAEWKQADPHAQISVASLGFSRGAVEAALFTQMVERRGIQNPEGRIEHHNPDGSIQSLEFTKPPLVEPGHVRMVAGLYDPVSTGRMALTDTHLAPSVSAALQLTAQSEKRDAFKVVDIVPPGTSRQGHFVNATVAGTHSDVGGSYAHDGLSIRSGNLMAEFLNKASDKPFLQPQQVPQDPQMNVGHRSEQHRIIYSTTEYTLTGNRGHVPADGSLPKLLQEDNVSGTNYQNQKAVQPPASAHGAPAASHPHPGHGAHAPEQPQSLHRRQISQAEEPSPAQALTETERLLQAHPHLAKLHEQVKEAAPHLNATEQGRLTAAAGVEAQRRGFDFAQLGDLEVFDCKGRPTLNVDDMVKQARNPYTSTTNVDIANALQTPVQDSMQQMQNVQVAQAQFLQQSQQQGQGGPTITM